jgi:hypothetical protein
MGASESTPQAAPYQPSFLEQHVRTAGALQSPEPTKVWQGQRSAVGADSYAISEAKRANGLVKGAGYAPAEAPIGSIAESWLMVQMKRAADVVSDSVGKGQPALPTPTLPAENWVTLQLRNQLKPSAPTLNASGATPESSAWLTGVRPSPTTPEDPLPQQPTIAVGGGARGATADWAASWQTQSQEPTESDRSDSTPSEPGSSAADSAASEEDEVVAEVVVAAPSASSYRASKRFGKDVSGQSSDRGVPRSVFLERVKSLQAFHANTPTGLGSASLLTPQREKASDRPVSSGSGGSQRGKTATPRRFSWMTTTTQKDVYKMGRYDIVTANLHGAYEVVKGSDKDNVYRGIDAELVA